MLTHGDIDWWFWFCLLGSFHKFNKHRIKTQCDNVFSFNSLFFKAFILEINGNINLRDIRAALLLPVTQCDLLETRKEMRMRWKDVGPGQRKNINADLAAASRAPLTFSRRLGEGNRVKVSRQRKWETLRHRVGTNGEERLNEEELV